VLSAEEIRYLKTQGEPEVSPVACEYDGKCFYIGSRDQLIFFRTRRYRNIKNGNTRVCLVIDDLESIDPWKPRGIKVRGTTKIVEHESSGVALPMGGGSMPVAINRLLILTSDGTPA
jgi:PPOX class F420-dependent enzyme/OxyR family protein